MPPRLKPLHAWLVTGLIVVAGLLAGGRMLLVWAVLGVPWAGWLLWRRQAGLRATAGVLAAAVEQSRSAVMIFNGQGVIAHVNGGFCRLVGRDRRELVGRNWRDFPVTDPGTPPQLAAELAAAIQAHRAWEGEW